MVNVNGSFASPAADATVSVQFSNPSGLLMTIYNGFTWWSALLTLFLAAVIYDQGMSPPPGDQLVAYAIGPCAWPLESPGLSH